jgi:hypothetical protein
LGNASVAGLLVLVDPTRSIANACTAASDACVEYANLDGFSLAVINYTTTGTAAAITPGTYTVGAASGASGTFAFVSATKTDATCTETLTGAANPSGTVTVTAVNSITVTGSYRFSVYGTPHSGSFTASVCASGAFQGDICSGGSGTCTTTKQCLP